jgi:ribose transport system permease protein
MNAQATAQDGRSRGDMLRTFVAQYAVVLFFVVLVAGFSLDLPETFPTTGNLRSMVSSQSVLLILALAVTIPLRTGDFDLSIGAVTNFSAAVVGVLTVKHGVPLVPAMLIALAMGALIGAINGACIVWIGVDAFVTTLGTMTAILGLTYLITNSEVLGGLPHGLTSFSGTEIIGFPLAAYYGWALAVVMWWVYKYLPIGRYLLFVGGNREAARLAGLPVNRIRFGSFVASSLLSAFAGLTLAGTLGAVDPSVGAQFLLPPYAAAFLGTTTIQVGRFNVVGTVVGLYLLIVGITGLQLLGAQPWISNVFNGTALVAAIIFAKLAARRELKV